MRPIRDIIERVRAEFMEMPGLRLKVEQVQRLCGIEQKICQLVLDALVDEKLLCLNSDGHYARLTTGQHPHVAKKEVRGDWRSEKAS